MSESLNICLSCGFCCNGTLIGFVQLDGDELSVLRELKDIEEVGEKGFFFLPCNNLGSNGCSIYAQRPQNCRVYNCKMLKSIEKQEFSFEAAIEVIAIVKQKKSIIETQLAELPFALKSKSFYFKIIELEKHIREGKPKLSLWPNNDALIANLKQLDDLVLKHFGISYD